MSVECCDVSEEAAAMSLLKMIRERHGGISGGGKLIAGRDVSNKEMKLKK